MRLIPALFGCVVLCLLFPLNHAVAQPYHFSRSQLLNDLNFLSKAVSEGHPSSFVAPQKQGFNELIAAAKNEIGDSVTASTYRKWIGRAVYEIGCIHSNIYEMPENWPHNKLFFPHPVYTRNDSLWYFEENSWHLIQQINGIAVDSILPKALKQISSDGKNRSFDERYFLRYGREFLTRTLNAPAEYVLLVGTSESRISAVDSLIQPQAKVDSLPRAVLERSSNKLYRFGDSALLVVKSFSKKDRAFFNSCYSYLQTNNIQKLTLDLRGNGGGNRAAAARLGQLLLDTSFGYTLLLSKKQRAFKYYNAKGKVNYLLGRFKYGVAELPFRRAGKHNAKRWVYQYRPLKKPYSGELTVFVDPGTASSATMLASWIRQHRKAVFIGQVTGGGYAINYGGIFPLLELPESKIILRFPAMALILDENQIAAGGLIPDYRIPLPSPFTPLLP